MFIYRSILGALVLVLAVASASADVSIRPTSRTDAMELRLSLMRVNARPTYMLRYPVEVNFGGAEIQPRQRVDYLPNTRWSHKTGSDLWTRAAMHAVGDLQNIAPQDIDHWCPAYRENQDQFRRAFWVGMMSALAKHESTYNPNAVGGGDLWYGLLQIYPDTARRYGCNAQTGDALKSPSGNLSCAARIMAVTVARDNAIAVYDGRWRGVAADWGPMSNRAKIAEMSAWTRRQDYCVSAVELRPRSRPELEETYSSMDALP